ncbi:MAG: aldo/keto reductase [Candidatus Melainabacteria bacterium HGW-Melainabacteria-1]|nr:MAG: aldo/keto reductase [Candidatus Melainabacteria bacterium HGW-Melainabacteria-1]
MPETSPSQPPVQPLIQHHGQRVPSFLYGTAWKEDRTEALTRLALQAGFRGIDTANQRKHYYEEGVGRAVQAALAEGLLSRADLFLQTKFTFVAGQDHRLPYDPTADFATQVQQSFASSLKHLGTDYLDAYVLHGPSTGTGLGAADWQVWEAMEALQKSGSVKLLGVSNVRYDQLELLLERAAVKPVFVQNRCYAQTGWDARVRELCRKHAILYQGFSLLTANARELSHPSLHAIAARHDCSVSRLVFRFALQVGMMPLTGTSNPEHMREDLAAYEIALSEAEINTIANIG